MTTKKSYAARLGVLALVLTLMTTCLLGGTMAKYTTEVTGTGSATVAKWSFKANGQTEKFDAVDLASTAYDNVGTKRIAPGTEGSFAIQLDASASEVAVDYAIKFSNMVNKPVRLKFYSDQAHGTEISLDTGLTGAIALADVGTTVTETIYWAWPYEAASGVDDNKDSGKSVTFDIAVTGTQHTPTASA